MKSKKLVFPWKVGDKLKVLKLKSWSSYYAKNPIDHVTIGDYITITKIGELCGSHIPFAAAFKGIEYGFSYFSSNEYKLIVMKDSNNYSVTRSQMQEIHDIACTDWRIKLKEFVSIYFDPFSDKAILPKHIVRQMFDDAAPHQIKVLQNIFPEYTDFKDGDIVVSEVNCTICPFNNKKIPLSMKPFNRQFDKKGFEKWRQEREINLLTESPSDNYIYALNELFLCAKYLNGDWELDLSKTDFHNNTRYSLYYNVYRDNIEIYTSYDCCTHGISYFKTEELARKAIEILGKETIINALSISI